LAAPQPDTADETLAAVVDYVDHQRQRLGIPGMAVAIVVGDDVRVVEGLGVDSDGSLVTPDTVFLINSISKSVTAFALMQLVDSGLVDLDAPMTTYVPELAPEGHEVSVRDVMHHRSGIASELPPRSDQHDLESNVQLAPDLEPDADFQYTNANYDLLALVVERATGVPFADYVEDNIFEPLSMKRSVVGTEPAQRYAPGDGHYRWLILGYEPFQIDVDHGQIGSAAMYSTARDLAQYLVVHMNDGVYGTDRLVSEPGIATLHEAMPYNDEVIYGYGGGLNVEPANAFNTPTALSPHKTVWHDGASETYRSVIWMTLGPDIGMVILANGNDLLDETWIGQLSYGTRLLISGEDPIDVTNQGDFLTRWSKHIFLGVALVQVAFIFLVIPTLQQLHRGRRPSYKQWILLGSATVVDIAAAILVLIVTPAVAEEPLEVVIELPDFRILLSTILLAVAWGVIRTILAGWWLLRSQDTTKTTQIATA
jgi:CubicO group peptidase (beta-lactamase class C family)